MDAALITSVGTNDQRNAAFHGNGFVLRIHVGIAAIIQEKQLGFVQTGIDGELSTVSEKVDLFGNQLVCVAGQKLHTDAGGEKELVIIRRHPVQLPAAAIGQDYLRSSKQWKTNILIQHRL